MAPFGNWCTGSDTKQIALSFARVKATFKRSSMR